MQDPIHIIKLCQAPLLLHSISPVAEASWTQASRVAKDAEALPTQCRCSLTGRKRVSVLEAMPQRDQKAHEKFLLESTAAKDKF